MQKQGFNNTFELNMDDLLDKTFHSYRKHKTMNENVYFKWNPFNLVNKHFTRNGDQVYSNMMDQNIPKRIYQSRPNLVLNIGNEYLTFMLMEELASKFILLLLTMFRILQKFCIEHASKTHLYQVCP